MRRRRVFSARWTAVLLVSSCLWSSFAAPAFGQEAETADGRVEATLDSEDDRRIEKRFAATYASLESLQGVEASVFAWVSDNVFLQDLAR